MYVKFKTTTMTLSTTINVGPKEYRWNKLCNEVTMLPERILVWQKVFENLKEFFIFYSV